MLVASTVLALLVSPAFWFGWLAVILFIATSSGYGALAVTDWSLYLIRDGFLRTEIVASGPLEAEHLNDDRLGTIEIGATRFKFKAGYEKRFHDALEPLRGAERSHSDRPC